MKGFSFPVLVATSLSLPVPLHFLSDFTIAYCSAVDRIHSASVQKKSWLLDGRARQVGEERVVARRVGGKYELGNVLQSLVIEVQTTRGISSCWKPRREQVYLGRLLFNFKFDAT